jgi:hypothetical protein
MNKGDLNSLMAHWVHDADYIDEAGKVTRGKEALTGLFKKGLAEHKGSKISGKMHSLKFLRPDVAMEDGSLEFTAADGSKESNCGEWMGVRNSVWHFGPVIHKASCVSVFLPRY